MCAEVRVCDNTPGGFGKWRFMWCGWEVEGAADASVACGYQQPWVCRLAMPLTSLMVLGSFLAL